MLEESENQAEGIEQAGTSTETLQILHSKQHRFKQQSTSVHSSKSSSVCRQCGFAWPHTGKPCPAKGKTCKKCGKPNHFAKMCLTKSQPELPQARLSVPRQKKPQQKSNVRYIHTKTKETEEISSSSTESSSTDDGVFTIGNGTDKSKVPITSIEVNDVTVQMMIDTGASTDIIDEATYELINQSHTVQLEPDTSQMVLSHSWRCWENIKVKDKQKVTTFHILKGANGSLLSYSTARDLGLVNIELNNVTVTDTTTLEKLTKEYQVFQGVGKLKNYKVKLHIDKTVIPVAQSARRIPFHLRKKVSAELKKLEKQGIIEKVEGPTP